MDKLKSKKALLKIQNTEITEYHIYQKLSRIIKDKNNATVLQSIANEEKKHSEFWKNKTNIEPKPDWFKVKRYIFLSRVFGLSFALKLMEKREGTGSKQYKDLSSVFKETAQLSEEEDAHEKALLGMLNEERLQYVGSIVLGLNDALVELTGALAGFTLGFTDNKMITLAGLVTGISAAFSMAASNYLAQKADNDPNALKSALYTGEAYIMTVFLMILPYLLFRNSFLSLFITLAIVILVILAFNYYISVAKDLDFKHRFLEMCILSLSVAAFSFLISFLLKKLLGIEV
ncbi:MAG: VIT1/CCC1 transporter family protein [Spirochaetes bacterium]|nr:VIT1/CCC1 transporter family protein [Spirochaetota bacterium]